MPPVSFIADRFAEDSGHRFQMDNPKHQSDHVDNYFEVNWWPPKYPDLNRIENLKQCLREKKKQREKKQTKISQPAQGRCFKLLETLTPAVCKKYIGHLPKTHRTMYMVNQVVTETF